MVGGTVKDAKESYDEFQEAYDTFGKQAVDDFFEDKFGKGPSGNQLGSEREGGKDDLDPDGGREGGGGPNATGADPEDTTTEDDPAGEDEVTPDDLIEHGYTEREIEIIRKAPRGLISMDPFTMSRLSPTLYELLYLDPPDLAEQRKTNQLRRPTGYTERAGGAGLGALGKRTE